MEENVQIRCFTVGDVKRWLYHNDAPQGLSEQVIAKARAHAIIHSPYAEDAMEVICALYVNDELAAFTCVYPDKLTRPQEQLIYWFTTLWVEPKYRGRGFAYCVMGQLCEIHGDICFDLDGAPETVQTLQMLGLHRVHQNQYILTNKSINTNTLRGKLAKTKEDINLRLNKKEMILKKQYTKCDYKLEYVSFIDDTTYEFIRENSQNDVFLRSKEMLNWIIQYPIAQSSPLFRRVESDTQFSSTTPSKQLFATKVLKNKQLIGFYIIGSGTEGLHVTYLYFNPKYKIDVFYSLAEHVIHFKSKRVVSMNKELIDFLASYHLYSKYEVYEKSFSYPSHFIYDNTKSIQAGDGDNMV